MNYSYMDYELQYISNLDDIIRHGQKEKNMRTGINTFRIPSTIIKVDLEKEFPILKSKKVFWKSAADEILWMMQKCSNVTAELNSKIWDNWTGEDGTIGKTYGYQVGQKVFRDGIEYKNQVEYVLETLKQDPSNRQCVINMWNVGELDEMNLVPCAYSSVWSIINGRLNCMLVQRSADYPVGVPFDTTEYAILTHLFARHLGVQPGILTHVMADSHVYENQMSGVEKQIKNFLTPQKSKEQVQFKFKENAPTNFWEITLDDFTLENYNPCGVIKYEVAI